MLETVLDGVSWKSFERPPLLERFGADLVASYRLRAQVVEFARLVNGISKQSQTFTGTCSCVSDSMEHRKR